MHNVNIVNTHEIKKIAMFTDIHWGAKSNSDLHNSDCLNFIIWFIASCKENNVDAIFFLGDWFENRSNLNVKTLNCAYDGLKKLDELNIPIFMCVGNHDLYNRNNRDIHSILPYNEFNNVTIIFTPTVINDDLLLCPFLFKHEYIQYAELINSKKYVFGHFEFRDFIVTGSFNKMEHGPDHKQFKKPELIFSGHYHKRQIRDNIVYIGNAFPSNFGDAGDIERGMAILDVGKRDMEFINWSGCPGYFKTSLKKVVEGEWVPRENSRIRCLLDLDITYNEAQVLKEEFVKAYNLREFAIEENVDEKKDAIAGGDAEEDDSLDLSNINDMVENLLSKVTETTTISSEKLINVYRTL